MKILTMPQRSPEWHADRVGSIGGTSFGQVISGKKNRLIYNLINEKLNGYAIEDDYISDDMQFGIDNEPIARDLYIEKSGIQFKQVGMIKSDYSNIHHASPDGLSDDNSIVLEIKCSDDGAIQLQRFFEGVDTAQMPQIINYFAVSDEVKEVHYVSYCPYRDERPIVSFIFTRDTVIDTVKVEQETQVTDAKGNVKTKTIKVERDYTIQDAVIEGRAKIAAIEIEIDRKIQEFTF
jgi:hypothetical protein